MNPVPPYVWYASYGSNLRRARFDTYLKGGKPEGSTKQHTGSTDPTPATADLPIDLGRELFFAGETSHWGPGGVAFIRETPTGPVVPEPRCGDWQEHRGGETRPRPWTTYGRMYRITGQQFLDVVAQENNSTQPPEVDWEQLEKRGEVTLLGEGYAGNWYSRLLRVGTHQGEPIYTFTCNDAEALPKNPPSDNYIQTIIEGLTDTLPHLDSPTLADYLTEAMQRPGDDGWRAKLTAFHHAARDRFRRDAATADGR